MTVQSLLDGFIALLNEAVLPFLIVIAFLVFIWNATQYFIFQSTSEEGRASAKSLALWGIIGFVFISSLWGIVNLFAEGLQLNNPNPVAPDYICDKTNTDCQQDFWIIPREENELPNIDEDINNDIGPFDAQS
jgi:hypothetical protein